MNIKLKHEIGETINAKERKYKVIGFEYVKGRGIRYILLHTNGGQVQWEYMYGFDIKAII